MGSAKSHRDLTRVPRARNDADEDGSVADRVGCGLPDFTEGDQPIQHLVVLYHPDHYRFVVDLIPRTGAAAFQVRPGTRQPVKEDTP